MATIRVGAFPPLQGAGPDPGAQTEFVHRAADAGLDHVCTGDHVSFFVGAGFDGLVSATSLAAVHPTMPVYVAVLALRHPTLVARQLADLELLAPGRLILGVGVGGEDPHEYAVCGIDPTTRGRRMDECLTVVRELMTGKPVTFHGEFVDVDDALIAPAPHSPVPLMQVWCGIAPDRADARARVAIAMEGFYQLPFERFERYSPYGPPAEVAEFLAPYVAAGCTTFNLIPQSPHIETAVEGVAEVKRLLADV